MKVSVVIACFNSAAFVEAAVRSAFAQTLADIECIAVDDGSTDETPEILNRLAQEDPRLRVLAMPQNGGPSAARNAAIDAARGEFIAVLDSDDSFHPSRLARLVELADDADADFMADNQMVVAEDDGRGLGPAFRFERDRTEIDLTRFLAGSVPVRGEYSLGYLKPIMRRTFLNNHGLRYDTRYSVGEDFLLYVDALLKGARFGITDEPLYVYTKRLSSLTRSGGWTLRVLAGMSREILERHGGELSPSAQQALKERVGILHRRAQALDLADRLRARDPRGAAALLAREPVALAALGRELVDVGRRRFQRGPVTGEGRAS